MPKFNQEGPPQVYNKAMGGEVYVDPNELRQAYGIPIPDLPSPDQITALRHLKWQLEEKKQSGISSTSSGYIENSLNAQLIEGIQCDIDNINRWIEKLVE